MRISQLSNAIWYVRQVMRFKCVCTARYKVKCVQLSDFCMNWANVGTAEWNNGKCTKASTIAYNSIYTFHGMQYQTQCRAKYIKKKIKVESSTIRAVKKRQTNNLLGDWNGKSASSSRVSILKGCDAKSKGWITIKSPKCTWCSIKNDSSVDYEWIYKRIDCVCKWHTKID